MSSVSTGAIYTALYPPEQAVKHATDLAQTLGVRADWPVSINKFAGYTAQQTYSDMIASDPVGSLRRLSGELFRTPLDRAGWNRAGLTENGVKHTLSFFNAAMSWLESEQEELDDYAAKQPSLPAVPVWQEWL